MMRTSLLTAACLLALSLPPGARAHSPNDNAASAVTVRYIGGEPLDGHFSLIDQNRRLVSDRDFRGTPMLIYFGYTNCPDTCPLDAQMITNVVDLLDARGEHVTPVFITVDPERDTPERLKAFLSAFHPRFAGLTGAVAEIRRVTAAYAAEDDRINERPSGEYGMLHPAIAYLMGRKGEFLDLIRLKAEPDAIAGNIEAALAASE